MKTYAAIHHHRHGVSVFAFKSLRTEFNDIETADALGIDFEPDKDEILDIVDLDVQNVPVI